MTFEGEDLKKGHTFSAYFKSLNTFFDWDPLRIFAGNTTGSSECQNFHLKSTDQYLYVVTFFPYSNESCGIM